MESDGKKSNSLIVNIIIPIEALANILDKPTRKYDKA